MTQNHNYVFLLDCADFSQAQVVKAFLKAQGLNPRVRDEHTRSIAPHYSNLLGKLTVEIPEDEYVRASLALEDQEKQQIQIVTVYEEDSEGIAKKALFLSILGCVLIPIVCNLYSMLLGYRVLKKERPLGRISRRRLMMAIVFNSVAFYFWLTVGNKFLTNLILNKNWSL